METTHADGLSSFPTNRSGIATEAPPTSAEYRGSGAAGTAVGDASAWPVTMASATPSNPAAITMHVRKSGFTFHHNKVLLSLAIEAPAGSSGPVTMTMTRQQGSSEKILAENDQPSGGARDIFVVSVAPGNYVVQAEMPDATGPLQFNMSLVGDVNGDHKRDRPGHPADPEPEGRESGSAGLLGSPPTPPPPARSTRKTCPWPARTSGPR